MKQFDYSPLSQRVSLADARTYIWSLIEISPLGIGMTLFFMIIIVSTMVQTDAALVSFFVLVLILLIIAMAFIVSAVLSAVRRVKITRFATQNNMIAKFEVKDPAFSGLYFEQGYEKKIVSSIEIPEEGITIGSYQYTTGSGKSRRVHKVGFAKSNLSRRLPHIVLDNKHNNFWKMSNLPTYFDQNQKLSLEGDFDKHFTLYAPKEYEHDALYIFTPDVMATFIDDGYAMDAEIIDNQLCVYVENKSNLSDPDFIKTFYSAIGVLGEKLEKQTDYYKDERVATRSENIVAPAGRRLKPGISVITIVGVALFITFQFFNFIQDSVFINGREITPMQFVFSASVILLVAGALGYSYYNWVTRNK